MNDQTCDVAPRRTRWRKRDSGAVAPRALRIAVCGELRLVEEGARLFHRHVAEFSMAELKAIGSNAPAPDILLVDLGSGESGLVTAAPLIVWTRLAAAVSVVQVFRSGPMARAAGLLSEAIESALLGVLDGEATDASSMETFGRLVSTAPDDLAVAIRLAAAKYRGELTRRVHAPVKRMGVVIDPAEYVSLLEWVDEGCDVDATSNEGEMPGLAVTGPTGNRDVISVAALFPEPKPAPIGSFATKGGSAGLPDLVEFLRGLGALTHAYHLAVSVVARFPVGDSAPPPGETLTRCVDQARFGAHAKLVRFLVVFLQGIRQHYAFYLLWLERFNTAEWNPAELSFRDSAPSRTLAGTLERVFEHICRLVVADRYKPRGERGHQRGARGLLGATFAEEDIQSEPIRGLPLLPARSVRFHLDLLEAQGLVRREPACPGQWLVTGLEPRTSLPPAPREMVPGWLKSSSRDLGLLGGLMRTLGFKSEQHPLRRIVAGVGIVESADASDFLRRLLDEGRCPEWLRALGRTFASRTLGWSDVDHWPRFLE